MWTQEISDGVTENYTFSACFFAFHNNSTISLNVLENIIEISSQILMIPIDNELICLKNPANHKTLCLLFSHQVQVGNKMTHLTHRGARAVYSHCHHLPPQSRCCPGESKRPRTSPVTQLWEKEGWGLQDWLPHYVSIFLWCKYVS